MSPTSMPLTLRTGDVVWVRSIEADDAPELQRAFALLSDLSRYQRFLTGTPVLTDHLAQFFSDIDQVNHAALVALPAERSREIVGVARFIRDPGVPSDADLAVTVADPWHGRGLATRLLDLLSEHAVAVGVQRFTVDMVADNDAVRALVRAAGGGAETVVGQVATSRIELEPVVVALSRAALPRVAADVPVEPVPRPLGTLVPGLRVGARAVVALDDPRQGAEP